MTYKRVLLKLSGEALLGPKAFGIDQSACKTIAYAIKALRNANIDVGIVIGGGNIFRGLSLETQGVARTPADQMGMLATIMNGIALQQALTQAGCPAIIMSALECPKVVGSYRWEDALQKLQEGNVLIFTGGTGNPYFTTDTASALRASEIKADILLKLTKVDGVYNKDPIKYPDAVKYDALSYTQALEENLQVMDAAAISLCRDSRIPIFVFNMDKLREDKIVGALTEKNFGTIIS